jgi:protein-S-isoprenylcysteine O-methyltransferase Ste14
VNNVNHRPTTVDTNKTDRSLLLTFVARSVALFFIYILVLFLCAGRLDYWQGWLFIAALGVLVFLSIARFSDMAELAAERLKPGPGMKTWDKVFMALYFPLGLGILAVGGLDAGRFGWTSGIPVWAYPVAVVVYAASFAFTRWAMLTNRWFSSVVRIQTERDQRVVRDGPYRFVRHPGYTGIIVSFMSSPIILGSLAALVPAGAVSLLLIVRTALEDRMLKRELPGYIDYARAVRYRLLPGVW